MSETKRISVYGLLAALSLIFSYAESQIPAFFAVPGMKLGLTNTVVLTALYLISPSCAFAVNAVRIITVFLLFGNFTGFIYSLAGGLLSTLVMILMKRTGRFRIVTVSIIGGISHNTGQILAAMVLLHTKQIAWYFAVLWFSGIASGAVIGLLGAILCERLRSVISHSISA